MITAQPLSFLTDGSFAFPAEADVPMHVERVLIDCLLILADLASTTDQPKRELRLRDAAQRLQNTSTEQVTRGVAGRACHEMSPGNRLQVGCPLTPRERQVAALVTSGLSNCEIGRELVIAESTVERHVANILHKLGLGSRVELAAWFVEHRIGLTG